MIVRHFIFTLVLVAMSGVASTQEAIKTDFQIPTTTLSFEQTKFNFGDITEGEIIQSVVTFTNTGDEPLIISNAKGSCGCTIPKWPKETIMPGESAELLVQFDSKGKGKEEGKTNTKRVTITANTDPVHSYVTITGKVFKQEEGQPLPERQESFDVDASTVKLWPNPVSELVIIDLSAYAGKSALVEVYCMLGERLDSRNISELSEEAIQLDLNNYETGTYTFSISIEGHNRIAKTIVVR